MARGNGGPASVGHGLGGVRRCGQNTSARWVYEALREPVDAARCRAGMAREGSSTSPSVVAQLRRARRAREARPAGESWRAKARSGGPLVWTAMWKGRLRSLLHDVVAVAFPRGRSRRGSGGWPGPMSRAHYAGSCCRGSGRLSGHAVEGREGRVRLERRGVAWGTREAEGAGHHRPKRPRRRRAS